ncbi:hypothetical protein H1230_21675 [Paenibacillus sp. 19GGS1-52]|uniref:hypothetical protein n=1 Tax=Paenibacillus sp. 19GGS1-52 TaxID=2758563 RepID=UPI001EFAE6EB|nr:hypothetical protein [Paenibacillus sp. 19GGS1-52]ULO05663.1 hypothetical protein H1230_21675 [Paenibacillus sp. 19GGS1-52]
MNEAASLAYITSVFSMFEAEVGVGYSVEVAESSFGISSILTTEFYEGSSKHLQKAQNRLSELNNLAKSGKLGLNDLDIVDALRDDLEKAIRLFK